MKKIFDNNQPESTSRDIAPDALRGFALFGILIVNISYMALSSNGNGTHGIYVEDFANTVAGFLIFALFQGKFYLLFSFLFGYSSSYIIKNDKSNRTRWIKRCFFLMVLGALHGTLLWFGEILFIYGFFGLFLIPFFFRSDKTIKVFSRTIFFTLSVTLSMLVVLVVLAEKYQPQEDLSALFTSKAAANLDSLMLSGTYLESIGARTALWLESLTALIIVQGGFAFVAFLVGLRAARSKFLSLSTSDETISKMVKVGFSIGLPIQLLIAVAWLGNERSLNTSEAIYFGVFLLSMITAPLLSMGYLGAIMTLLRKKPNVVAWMKPAGKVSLTTYISQSFALLVIFAPWGLGLFRKVELWQLIPIAFAIWLMQTYLATLWLKKFKLGPFEAALNILTKNR